MADKPPPPWDRLDPLSSFFADAGYNERVSALNLAPVFKVLQRVHVLFGRVEAGIEKDNLEELLLPRFLMVRTHSSFLAGIRLAMSGQVSESYAVLRAGVEQTWYSLHIAKDPNPPERAKIWLNRNESEKEKLRCKAGFSVARGRTTHETIDFNAAKRL